MFISYLAAIAKLCFLLVFFIHIHVFFKLTLSACVLDIYISCSSDSEQINVKLPENGIIFEILLSKLLDLESLMYNSCPAVDFENINIEAYTWIV